MADVLKKDYTFVKMIYDIDEIITSLQYSDIYCFEVSVICARIVLMTSGTFVSVVAWWQI